MSKNMDVNTEITLFERSYKLLNRLLMRRTMRRVVEKLLWKWVSSLSTS